VPQGIAERQAQERQRDRVQPQQPYDPAVPCGPRALVGPVAPRQATQDPLDARHAALRVGDFVPSAPVASAAAGVVTADDDMPLLASAKFTTGLTASRHGRCGERSSGAR
jgi:hypothetical protein